MNRPGMRRCANTGGPRFREAERLHPRDVRTTCIRVDGLVDEHEAVHGPDSFRGALRGIASARAAGVHTVEAITCVRPANLDVLRDIEDVVREAGADRWSLLAGNLAGWPPDGAWLSPAQVRHLLEFIEERREALRAAGDRFDVRFSAPDHGSVRPRGCPDFPAAPRKVST